MGLFRWWEFGLSGLSGPAAANACMAKVAFPSFPPHLFGQPSRGGVVRSLGGISRARGFYLRTEAAGELAQQDTVVGGVKMGCCPSTMACWPGTTATQLLPKQTTLAALRPWLPYDPCPFSAHLLKSQILDALTVAVMLTAATWDVFWSSQDMDFFALASLHLTG